ncbi:hypothetical protein E3C22_22280 [Jiella endophytica]|uniref:Uncharacterized protein n=1 Tax=Jiella endophytica TaxID=2558362 RepID=A0A4Y8R8T6_9HYPH|nr:hypothetical protein [Jiella endophytica]TFF18033.1 hypothetical protein E3C22_22280 [Jiella endophytica]
MRIDEDKDLAEQVEGALRALGIAATRKAADQSPGITGAVSDLRKSAMRPEVRAERNFHGED